MTTNAQTFFTPVQTFLGGYLLHLSTSGLLEDTGTVLGISGIVDGAIWGTGTIVPAAGREKEKHVIKEKEAKEWVDKYWRWAVIGGILLAPTTLGMLGLGAGSDAAGPGNAVASWSILEGQMGLGRLTFAGLLVGLGSRLGSGCTSGHFLCGASRLSPRSIIATATFFPIAMLTSYLVPMTSTSSIISQASYIPTFPPLASLPTLILPLAISQAARMALRRLLATSSLTSLRLLPYLLSGWTFGMGLLMSGMADPIKVLSFLRISPGNMWDPSLAMVFLGGVIPNAIAYQRFLTKSAAATPKPRYSWATWRVPSRRYIDWKLLVGAAIFGIGWGIGGVCPGPGLVGLSSIALEQSKGIIKSVSIKGIGAYLTGMVIGMRTARML